LDKYFYLPCPYSFKLKRLKTYLLSLLLVISLGAAAQKQNLLLNLKTGETYTRSMTSNTSIKQDIDGKQMDINMSMACKMLFKVNSMLNNNYQMDISYERISIDMNMPGLNMNKDSGGVDINSMTNKMIKSIVGKNFSMEMSRTGKIVKSSIDQLLIGIFDGLPNVNAATRQKLESMLKQTFGEKAFKTNMESMSAYFPERPVAKGESWTVSTGLSSTAQINFTITYTLEDITGQHYIISGIGSISPNKDNPSSDINGISIKRNMVGTNKTTMKINKATGWIQEADLNQHSKGEIVMNSEKMPNGMTIHMETSSVMRITE
jgi:hypothetical protein